MRASLRLAIAVSLLTVFATTALAQSGIRWMSNLQDAMRIAQRDQRLLLLHFYADWCGPCRKLEQNVFPNPEVTRAVMSNYIPVKINADRMRDIATQYQVSRFPTDVIADSQGRVLYRTVSPQDPAQYTRLLDSVAQDNRLGPPVYAASTPLPSQGPAAFPGPGAPQDNRWDAGGQGSGYPSTSGNTGAFDRYQGSYYGTAAADGRGYPREDSYRAYEPRVNQDSQWQPYGPRYADQYAASGPAEQNPGSPPPMLNSATAPPRDQWNPYADTRPGTLDQPAAPQPPSYERQPMWQPPSRYADDRSTTAGPAAGQAPAWQPPAYAGQGNQFARDERGFAAPQPGYPNTPLTSSPRPEAQRPTSNVPLALDGYCPVTLAEQEKWEKGDVRWGVEHRGRLYLFQSPQYQQQFLADPDRFSPVLSGYDPTRYIDFGEMVPGRRRHGMWFRGKIYLFTDESSLDRFSQNPEYYAQRTHEIMMAAGR